MIEGQLAYDEGKNTRDCVCRNEREYKVRYIISSTIVRVEEKFLRLRTSHDGTTEYVSLGWFISLSGSYEALCLGRDKPELDVGDRVQITIERVK